MYPYSGHVNGSGVGGSYYEKRSGTVQKGRPRRRRGSRSYHSGGATVSGNKQPKQAEGPLCTEFDMDYFRSYSHVGVHEAMIKDSIRTETYKEAIMQHQSFIAGNVILSLFCQVYAVDASGIALQALDIVEANNLSDKIIVLHNRVEDVRIDDGVDVIISEWMGYMLLYESMLGSIIYARDRWLKPGGLILPSSATLYMAPVTQSDRYGESIDFWRSVYGIDSKCMLKLCISCAFEAPSIETISGENLNNFPLQVKYVDCYTVSSGEIEFVTKSYKFKSMMRAPLHGFAFWFDVKFYGPATAMHRLMPLHPDDNQVKDGSPRKKRANPNEALVLSTAPEDPPTHWQQTVVYFYDPLEVEQDQIIEGSVTLTQSREHYRFMNIRLEYVTGGRSFVKESMMR
ncbi:probable protein arginine N-methyltransferase 6 [Cucurbita moschata]|uniref:Probable protein arginine N-methyltransferase 6 n=1 Tax=Cucurbita moschata TaxID=3662 RepID=A0A6J1FDZ6_CUCMO|nr:probable protein arginine N-methyltransferase 6 [Cucurbita moschata]